MLDIGWGEMLVIAIVVIVVVGPKELPGMLRTFGRTTSKLRVMANDFRKQFDDALKEAELDDLKKVADDVRSLNPARDIKKALSPMEKAARDVRAGLDSAMKPGVVPDTGSTPAAATAQPAVPLKQGAAPVPGEAASAGPAKTAATAKPKKTPAPRASSGTAARPAAKAASAKPAAAKPAAAKAANAKAGASAPRAARPAAAPRPKVKTGGAAS